MQLQHSLQQQQRAAALKDVGDALKSLGDSVQGCGVPKIGAALEKAATQLHADGVASFIGKAVRLLVTGADVTPDIQKIIADSESGNWAGLGHDLGVLSSWITNTGCNSFVCRLVEGILQEADMALTDLRPCEAALREAEGVFSQGAAQFKDGHYETAVKYWASALNDVAQGVETCGLAQQLQYIQQEANVLGLGNVTILGQVAQILVHGANFYEEFYQVIVDMEKHDYRGAGANMGKVMNDLSEWTKGHLCTSDVCYIVNGMFEYLGDLESDIKACKSDFVEVWGNLSDAYRVMIDHNRNSIAFSHDASNIKQGVKDLGNALWAFSNVVSDCHMAELAQIIAELAAKLGIVPEVAWVEEVIKILIEGVPIEQEVAHACQDWAANDWPGVGYNVIKLIKSLAELGVAETAIVV